MQGIAQFAKVAATNPVEFADLNTNPDALKKGGLWLVVADFEGRIRCWRFAQRLSTLPMTGPDEPAWQGPKPKQWSSSLSRNQYEGAVTAVRDYVRAGTVYQANICRVLSAPLPVPGQAQALARVLSAGNPAPHEGFAHIVTGDPKTSGWLASASPESFLSVWQDRDGTAHVSSAPIKGTAPTGGELLAKDETENVMITDLVRNDLQRVCAPGTVEVTSLLEQRDLPGLVHLVSTVTGRLRVNPRTAPTEWAQLLALTLPAASISGAPKSSALRIIGELEPGPRGPYCGAIGWIDVDAGTCDLAVGIRTFWWQDQGPYGPARLHFGTGAGITWGSDPTAEWFETELKANRLIALASNTLVPEKETA